MLRENKVLDIANWYRIHCYLELTICDCMYATAAAQMLLTIYFKLNAADIVADATDWVQPACQEEWKMCRKKNE